MAGRARVASHLTSGKGRIPEDAGGYNACSLSRSQLPPVLSVGLRQRSIKAQGVAVGVGGQLVAQDDTPEPSTRAAMIKAMDVLMAPPLPPASAAAPPAAPGWATSGLRRYPPGSAHGYSLRRCARPLCRLLWNLSDVCISYFAMCG